MADTEAAEEVVQETWMGFLASMDRFEGRSSVKTWLFRILVNKAKTRGVRDHRSIPFSRLVREETSADGPVDPAWFAGPQNSGGDGHWVQSPAATPESILMDRETMRRVRRAIDDLPRAQGTVMLLRDVNGLSAEEVCAALGVTPGNQRVLLHRARTRVRIAITEYCGA